MKNNKKMGTKKILKEAGPYQADVENSSIDSVSNLPKSSQTDGQTKSDSTNKGGTIGPTEEQMFRNAMKLGCLTGKPGLMRRKSDNKFYFRKTSVVDPSKTIHFFSDMTYAFTDGSKKGRWKCDGILDINTKPNTDQTIVVTPNADQTAYIDSIVKAEGAIKEKPSQYEIDKGTYEVIDLNTRNAQLFPEKGKFFVYKQKGATNQVTSQQQNIIQSLKLDGWSEVQPNENESMQYTKINLQVAEGGKYKDYFNTPFYMWQPTKDINVVDLIDDAKKTFQDNKVDKKQCRQAIDILYTSYETNVPLADSQRIRFKNYAKKCATQKTFILPGIRKKLDFLEKLNPNHPSKVSLRMKNESDERIKSIVKESLMSAKKQKTKTLLEERKIVEKRLLFLTENVSLKTKKDKDKFCETLLMEMFYLKNQGFDKKVINEGFFDMISGIFGKAGSGIFGYFKEYFAKWLVTKFTPLDPNGWVGGTIIRAIGNLAIGDITKLTDCNFLSKLLSKSIAEEAIEQLKRKAGLEGAFYDILRNALVDSLEETDLGTKIESALGSFLCPLLSNVTGKMSDVADKMKKGALAVD